MPDRMPEKMFDRMSEYMPNRMSDMSGRIYVRIYNISHITKWYARNYVRIVCQGGALAAWLGKTRLTSGGDGDKKEQEEAKEEEQEGGGPAPLSKARGVHLANTTCLIQMIFTSIVHAQTNYTCSSRTFPI